MSISENVWEQGNEVRYGQYPEEEEASVIWLWARAGEREGEGTESIL